MDLKTTNDLLNWHVLEIIELLDGGNNLYDLGGTAWRNFLMTEISSTTPNEWILLTIVVNFMAKSSIDSPSFMRIALNSLFKVCIFSSLTRSTPSCIICSVSHGVLLCQHEKDVLRDYLVDYGKSHPVLTLLNVTMLDGVSHVVCL